MTNSEIPLTNRLIRVDVNDSSAFVDLEELSEKEFSIEFVSGATYSILYRGASISATLLESNGTSLTFSIAGKRFISRVTNRRMQLLHDFGIEEGGSSQENEIKSPMPGLVIKVLVEEGAQVEKDDPVIVLEAMKMENEIRSPASAIISHIHVQPGQSVPKNAGLITLNVHPTS